MKNRHLACLIIGLTISLVSCDFAGFISDLFGGGGVKFTGTLSSSAAAVSAKSKTISQNVDTIVAVAYENRILTDSIRNATSSTVEADGTFEISVPQGTRNCLLLLIDSTQVRRHQVAGYVALLENGESLIGLPIENSDNNVDFGNMTLNGDISGASMDFEEGADVFNTDLFLLRQRAWVDDVLKHVRNVYINYDPLLDVQRCETPLIFKLSNELPDANTASDQSGWYNNELGIWLYGETNFDTSLDDLLTETVVLELYPPADIDVGGTIFGPNNPITTAGLTDNSTPDYAFVANNGLLIEYDRQTREISQMYVGFAPQLPLPTDDWVLFRNGAEYAYFDIGFASPFDDDGNLRIYLPSLFLTVDATGTVTQLQVSWQYFDSLDNSFIDIVDTTSFIAAIDHAGISFVRFPDEDGYFADNFEATGFTLDQSHFGSAWAYAETVGVTQVFRVFGLDYVMGWE
jgi:hypothetical protein